MNEDLLELLAFLPDREDEALALPRLATADLCERFLGHVDATRIVDPLRALPLARFALRLAAKHPDALVGRAWAVWGSVHRALSSYDEAEAAYRIARLYLEEPVDLARFYRRQSYLLRDRGQFSEARAVIGRAVAMYLAAGDSHARGCALADLATVHFAEGDYGEAVLRNCEALRYLDPSRDPEYHTCTVHNLTAALTKSEQPGARLEVLLKEIRQQRYKPGTIPWAKHRWLEGLVFAGRERHQRAENTLRSARNQLLKLGAAYDAGLVTMDLAELHLERGEWEKGARLAQETVPIFRSLGVEREVLAACKVYLQAAIGHELEKPHLERLRGALQRLSRDGAARR
jgi:tetratricopeptide (TPR) repeat protein